MSPPVTVVVPGDLHLTEPERPNHRTALWVVDQVNTLVRPDFVQFIGDNVQDARPEQFRLFRDLTARLQVPWFALVGDHDAQGDVRAGRFREAVGDPTGGLTLRGFRFVRLNTQEARPVGLSLGQIEWFRAEMDQALADGRRVVVFQHNYPYQIWENYAGPGIDDWRTLVQTRRVTAIVTGHTHYFQAANDGRNALVATRSVGDPEGGDAGYLLLHFQGEDFALTYRTEADAGPLVLITHPREKLLATSPAHVVSGVDQVRARIWSAEPLASVRGRWDDRDWLALRPEDGDAWSAPLPGQFLAKGEHIPEVVAADAAGREGGQRIEFMVDPTGRYTAVPGVRPVVSATQFC